MAYILIENDQLQRSKKVFTDGNKTAEKLKPLITQSLRRVEDRFDCSFEWDLGVQVLLEHSRDRVLFDPTFKYIRDMIMLTNSDDEDED